MIKEYQESVGDKTVTIEDHLEIASDMTNVLDKMKEQVENISDSITAVRSQVVTLNNEDEKGYFTVSELVKYIDVLMKNTLKEYLIVLQFTIRVSKNLEIKGNLNALVQAVDNLIMNSIESYRGKTNQTIEVVIEKNGEKLEISVIDTGCGIPKRIQNKLFKEIITKEDTDKVGLGLFMAYSNIKARI
ncbi:MAG: HAMP domain-containing histidine kinase [Clostridia bacterium]|nr:HAMP domain-containing histidine kinase [Clostridia bacterium]